MLICPIGSGKLKDNALHNYRCRVKKGRSLSADEKRAVSEFRQAVYQPEAETVLFFCSSRYDLDRLGGELAVQFDCPLIGCTTAGEISTLGYQEGEIVVASFSSDKLKIHDDGEFKSDAAIFSVFETTLPFMIFKTQHFQPTHEKIVITGADPERRVITEINGEPAAVEYARVFGFELGSLGIIGDMNQLLRGFNAIGFGTYGEQFNSIHVNQTLTAS